MWGTPVTSTNLTNFRISYYKAKKAYINLELETKTNCSESVRHILEISLFLHIYPKPGLTALPYPNM